VHQLPLFGTYEPDFTFYWVGYDLLHNGLLSPAQILPDYFGGVNKSGHIFSIFNTVYFETCPTFPSMGKVAVV
jgi:hypothetical protein